MPNFNPRKFSSPENAKQDKAGPVAGLVNCRCILTSSKRGFDPSQPRLPPQPVDFEKTGSPLHGNRLRTCQSSFVDSLYLIHEMAHPAGMDAIIEGAKANGLSFDAGPEPTPADVAVQGLAVGTDACLENLHNCQELTRPALVPIFFDGCGPRAAVRWAN